MIRYISPQLTRSNYIANQIQMIRFMGNLPEQSFACASQPLTNHRVTQILTTSRRLAD